MILIEAHAIISDDDRIADASGRTPPALFNEADWAFFQAELDRAAVVVCGRIGHQANPNLKNRPRLIVSSGVDGIERRPDGLWWNPARVPWDKVAGTVAPHGGLVAVTGGQAVFDLFLSLGTDIFHLVRKAGVTVGGGRRVFAACETGARAEEVLAASRLQCIETRVLDASASVTLQTWKRAR